MKITRWPLCWAVIWGIFAVLLAIGGSWYAAWVAAIFCLVNVREFYAQQQINGLRALVEAERARGDAWEKEHEDLRVLGLIELHRLEDLNAQFLGRLRAYEDGPMTEGWK